MTRRDPYHRDGVGYWVWRTGTSGSLAPGEWVRAKLEAVKRNLRVRRSLPVAISLVVLFLSVTGCGTSPSTSTVPSTTRRSPSSSPTSTLPAAQTPTSTTVSGASPVSVPNLIGVTPTSAQSKTASRGANHRRVNNHSVLGVPTRFGDEHKSSTRHIRKSRVLCERRGVQWAVKPGHGGDPDHRFGGTHKLTLDRGTQRGSDPKSNRSTHDNNSRGDSALTAPLPVPMVRWWTSPWEPGTPSNDDDGIYCVREWWLAVCSTIDTEALGHAPFYSVSRRVDRVP